jgi:tetratricopeptide (TPR) repeat protein
MAKEMELRDQFAWSVREYRRAIDGQPVEAPASLLSRVSLANMLHDHEDYKTAVEVLEPLAKGLQPGSAVMQAYDRLQRQRDLRLDERQVVLARFHYYRACQFHADEDWQRQRESLETALRFDRTDADVLIAMYRVPEADDQWRTTTRRKIADLCRDFQQKIEAAPDDPNAYNQWAWLVSNTEGDFQQAIRYSHKSLELLPPGAESASASLLDTLGRCYYAAGDFENAVKHQRQAVEKAPYMKTMQRQLELFEKALAEQQRAGNGAPATETQDVK